MTEGTRRFIYRDARGSITFRVLTDATESDEYVQGQCLDRGMLRTFRKDRILEELGDDVAAPEVAARLTACREAHTMPAPKRTGPSVGTLEVCFTGFKAAEKADLIGIAESAAFFFVRPSVTKNLHFLVCGEGAGPAKVKKARAQGVMALSGDEFRVLAETGEPPDDT